ncbi:auxin-responsive protein SAUR71-like [Senna tora]|uniref:Auxin-responsive protein SAUR71-like n=1 Tax=Senna tora TaxID=362788 RepID=A0A834WZ54_9FABA|nr:auxin-responsive protein SAUR71-like [Senna tora]
MKQLIRRLSRVADSSQYTLLRSDSQSRRPRRAESFRSAAAGAAKIRRSRARTAVPEGHVPIYVGDEMERFVVSAELLNHPIFVKLLNRSAQEYGYEQKGVLRIPCHVFVFERVLEALRLGNDDARDIQELLNSSSSSSEEFCWLSGLASFDQSDRSSRLMGRNVSNTWTVIRPTGPGHKTLTKCELRDLVKATFALMGKETSQRSSHESIMKG